MFASLLDRRGTASLLSRRKNTHDKIQALKEEDGEDGALQQEVPAPKRKSSFGGNSPSLLPLRLDSGQSSSKTSPNPSPALTRHSNDAVSDVDKPNCEKPGKTCVCKRTQPESASYKLQSKRAKMVDHSYDLSSTFRQRNTTQLHLGRNFSSTTWQMNLPQAARQQVPSRSPSRRNGLNALVEMDNASSTPQRQRPRLSNYTHTSGGHSSP